MKTVILAINAKYIHTALAPWYLKAAVRAANTEHAASIPEPEVLETHINRRPDEILAAIIEARPDILAVSCYIWNIVLVEQLLAEVSRLLPSCILILGGPEVSYNSADRLRDLPMVDFVVCGEGEGPFVLLMTALHQCQSGVGRAPGESKPSCEGKPPDETKSSCEGKPPDETKPPCEEMPSDAGLPDISAFSRAWSQIPGLTWRDGDQIVCNPVAEAAGDPPDPCLPAYRAQVAGRIVYLETSRGCPFDCGFCLSGRPGQVRHFDQDKAKRDLVMLAQTGTDTVKLVDRTWNCHPQRCREMIRFLLEANERGDIPADVRFHFEVAADLFDRDTLDLLIQAPTGLFQLEIGLQSFHAPTLEAIGRKTDMDRAKETIRRLRQPNHIHLHLDLIAGLPEEDLRTFAHSFDEAYALAPHMLQLGFLKLLHGSRLREQCRQYGIAYDPRPPYRVRRTNWLSESDLEGLARCEGVLGRLYNSGRFPATCARLLGTAPDVDIADSPAIMVAAFSPVDSRTDPAVSSPFQLFFDMGRFIGDVSAMSLETFILRILAYVDSVSGGLSHTERDDLRETLRDCLVIDWLQTNPVGVLPLCLQREDRLNAKVRQALARRYQKEDIPPALGLRRPYGFGLLYGGGKTRIALADYRQPRPALGNYPLRIIDAAAISG